MMYDETTMTDEEQQALEEEATYYDELENGYFMLMNDHEEHEIERLMAYADAHENH